MDLIQWLRERFARQAVETPAAKLASELADLTDEARSARESFQRAARQRPDLAGTILAARGNGWPDERR